uniref:receptor-like protein kinase FERONIA n=1 Tax=Erigeron canadensis TaxID=72917 RepID=UPI001CB9B0C1|nr:receptor-like protein kinase FERONIA [Erigeron canadensis]
MSSSSSNVYASVMSLNEYLASIKISLEEIESATNNFNDENLITQTSSSKIYKGRLIQSSGEFDNIVVRICMQLHIVVNEVIILKDLRHKNIAPILKISQPVNDNVVIIINKYEANESLDKHLSSGSTLSWMQRLHICVGIADALSYLHYDAIGNQSTVIHGNIKSSKILLDQDWEPKLHGFGFAVRAKRNQIYLTNQYNGSLQYMDPAYETTRGLTNKSDVFSFGVVLFEVLFGRDASSSPDHNDSLGFARLAQFCYEEKRLDDMINSDLREQMNLESLNIFSEVAYFCLKEQRLQRPDMKHVLQILKGALDVQRKHESLEHSTPREDITSSSSSNVDNSVLSREEYIDSISIPFEDIESATNNFAEENLVIQTFSSKIYKGRPTQIYKGRLTQTFGESVNIVVRIDDLNYNEIDMLKDLRHKNIVPIYKITRSKHAKVIINKHEANGSLNKHLDSSTLSWMQRLHICVGIARALSYLHYEAVENHSVIHSNIKSSKILLDHNWDITVSVYT